MRLVEVDGWPPQVFIRGRRTHHGFVGAVVAGTGLAIGSPALVIAGAALMAHDIADRRRWIIDFLAYPRARR